MSEPLVSLLEGTNVFQDVANVVNASRASRGLLTFEPNERPGCSKVARFCKPAERGRESERGLMS